MKAQSVYLLEPVTFNTIDPEFRTNPETIIKQIPDAKEIKMKRTPFKQKYYKLTCNNIKLRKTPLKRISKKQAKRNQNLSRIKKTMPQFCSQCGSPYNLELHHIRKRSLCGTDDISNLTMLCHTCHAKIV